MNSVGVGYLFRPTDKQLVCYFLHKKATGELQTLPSCYNKHVFDFDFYDEEPWILWDRFGGPKLQQGEDLYFFTKLKKVSANGSRVSRKVGSGTWSGDSSDLVYDSGTQNPIGLKKNFRYEMPGSDGHGCWLMNEYSNPNIKDVVLCRLRKNDRNENKKIKNDTKRKRKLTGSSDHQELTEKKKKLRKSGNPSIPIEEQHDVHHQLPVDRLTNIITVSDYDIAAASAYFDSDEFMLRKSANPCNFNGNLEEQVSGSTCEQSLVQNDDQTNDISVRDCDISSSSACAYFEPEFKRLLEDDHDFIDVDQMFNDIFVDHSGKAFASSYFESDEFKKLESSSLLWTCSLLEIPARVAATLV